ncbi:AAEL004921-PA [Aedes aegypti]|uniref:AAEL004921-PA n=2 Tax=Aedes aegypti TaxID=7159 RepID=A0A1S4F907_AEDAE|nr:endocuticle structural glycoprotein SgAbd-2 [Aedes aegypti]EAT43647.1 AAEL004921-PA [Aedes aegypti]
MKVFFAVVLLVAAVSCAPQDPNATPVPIVSQTSNLNPDGSFQYSYESGNGIKVEDQGELKVVEVPKEDGTGTEQAQVSVQKGSYSYNAPDGTPITLQWTADENGFHATGDHLPVAPVANA